MNPDQNGSIKQTTINNNTAKVIGSFCAELGLWLFYLDKELFANVNYH